MAKNYFRRGKNKKRYNKIINSNVTVGTESFLYKKNFKNDILQISIRAKSQKCQKKAVPILNSKAIN